MLKDVQGLHKRGLELLWLHPKSKRPIDLNWTKLPKKNFQDLKNQYKNGMNVGVRLGSWSKSGGFYLGVIDCDVKSSSPHHKEEMRKKLGELFPGLMDKAPFVASGRGNGSGHLYIKTKKVIKGFRLAQSNEKVRVKMPSAPKATKADIAAFAEDEIKEGWRLRAAWEISFMGEGQQVVLPPSVHPDTGKEYQWVKPLGVVPEIDLPTTDSVGRQMAPNGATTDSVPIEFEDVDLIGLGLSDKNYRLITLGDDCEDRSAGLMSACIALLKAGCTDNQILSVLTDEDNFLGVVAFEHRKTSDRTNAAQWVRDHTLKKAKAQTLASEVFDSEVEETELSEEAAQKQKEQIKAMMPEKTWEELISRTAQGIPKVTLNNLVLFLKNLVGPNAFKWDDFTKRDIYGCNTPWGGKKGEKSNDKDDVLTKHWFSKELKLEPSVSTVKEAIAVIGHENKFHPVREWIDSFEWDGKPRINTWLKDYLGAEAPEPYLSEVSRKIICALVARVFQPGIKFDNVLIIEGPQGLGKSSALESLVGREWFLDKLPNIDNKDALVALQGIWLVEIGELKNLRQSDIESYKAFFSSNTDKFRAPYGKGWEAYPRQCIFIGSTNLDDYLKDKTGNRRFWPVKVSSYDFDSKPLEKIRGQLFAEAKFMWESLEEPLFLSEKARKQSEIVQGKATIEDEETVHEERLRDFLEKYKDDNFMIKGSFKLHSLFEFGGPFEGQKLQTKSAAYALKKLGFEKCRIGDGHGWRKGPNFGVSHPEKGFFA